MFSILRIAEDIMKRRLYFVIPDLNTARQIEKELLLERINDDQMHFLGKRGLDLMDLPEANTAQRTDMLHGSLIGLVSGAAAGTIIGIVLYMLRDYLLPMELGGILLMFLMGAIFGVWISGLLIGTSTPNVKLERFQNTLEEGHILLMVDIAKDDVDKIKHIILSHHPNVQDFGMDPTIPAFP
jgi:hypothetical protein